MGVTTQPGPALPPGETLRAALPSVRRDHATREIVRRWRALVKEARAPRTLVACSGGADSVALLLALASAGAPIVAGHVVHDMRPAPAPQQDRDFVQALAAALGTPFTQAAVRVPAVGNAEGQARRLRYEALADLASQSGCAFVASAHHADDQLETLLMALVRGSGLRGMRGVAHRRALAPGVTLIRPMLGVTRADAERLCAIARVPWREDPTNLDRSRLRAAIRHGVLPTLRAIRPAGAARAADTADALRDALGVVEDRAASVFGDGHTWPREALREERAVVLEAGLRHAFRDLTGGRRDDRLSGRLLRPAIAAIRSRSGEARAFDWPGGVRLLVDRDTVRLQRRDDGA